MVSVVAVLTFAHHKQPRSADVIAETKVSEIFGHHSLVVVAFSLSLSLVTNKVFAVRREVSTITNPVS